MRLLPFIDGSCCWSHNRHSDSDNNSSNLCLRGCVDRSKLFPDRPTLPDDCLKAILPICNKGNDAKKIRQHLGDLLVSTAEEQMYKPFIQASNLALDLLSKLDVPGLVCSKAHNDDKILFHQNDPKKHGPTALRRKVYMEA
ncbi:hypothetical protein P692DRAFT_20426363 [Suillus brevipes Sb2]|nr:hypothetical protein P692DRAFT_20426363 [Suillus brevipes Sb2]